MFTSRFSAAALFFPAVGFDSPRAPIHEASVRSTTEGPGLTSSSCSSPQHSRLQLRHGVTPLVCLRVQRSRWQSRHGATPQVAPSLHQRTRLQSRHGATPQAPPAFSVAGGSTTVPLARVLGPSLHTLLLLCSSPGLVLSAGSCALCRLRPRQVGAGCTPLSIPKPSG